MASDMSKLTKAVEALAKVFSSRCIVCGAFGHKAMLIVSGHICPKAPINGYDYEEKQYNDPTEFGETE